MGEIESSYDYSKEYFEWLINKVFNPEQTHLLNRYTKLLSYLFNVDFYSAIENDENREEDGLALRNYFMDLHPGIYPDALSALSNRSSVLEMMIALADRCETHIMSNPQYGDRTYVWFWSMIENLDLLKCDNENFNKDYADFIIFRFLNREYEPNGKGGLFTTNDESVDMRNIEIWCQLHMFLRPIIALEYDLRKVQ